MTQQNNETKQSQPVKNVRTKLGYLPTYEENVFEGGREAITKGKFHDMFMAGDGHELEDYVDEKGVFHLAHAKAIHSSSMLAYNFFHWVDQKNPLVWEYREMEGELDYCAYDIEIKYDKVYFEVKFPIMTKPTVGRPVNRPANMDVVLISKDCDYMLCIESKYTEHTKPSNAEFADAYFDPSCYYAGNPHIASFIKMAKHYNGKSDGYYAGIKQAISHLIGLTNIRYDADALAWFKANNPFIEPEVLAKIDANTKIIFTNLMYDNDQLIVDNNKHSYWRLLKELLEKHLEPSFDIWDYSEKYKFERILLCDFISSYDDVYTQFCKYQSLDSDLFDYLWDRYEPSFSWRATFPLPEEYDNADQYLTDKVMEGARERYQSELSKEVIKRIKSELAVIRYRHWANRFLIKMDYVRVAHEHGFCTSPSSSQMAGSVVCYALGITDIDPISAGLNADRLLDRPILHDNIAFSSAGKDFIGNYLDEKYYNEMYKKLGFEDMWDEFEKWTENDIAVDSYSDHFALDIAEKTIAAIDDKIDFRTLPFNTPEQIQFFIADNNWRDYTDISVAEMQELRAIKQPTFKDIVRILSEYGDSGMCVLFLHLAWLKMHYPEPFQKVVNNLKEKNALTFAKWRLSDSSMRRNNEEEKATEAVLKTLTPLKDTDRMYILGVTRWHREGLVNLKNGQDIPKIKAFLKKFLKSPIRDLYNENFACKETGTQMTFDEMRKLLLMDCESTFIGLENAGKKYLCKRIKSREDFDEFKPYLENWCVIDDADAFENYTLGGSNKMFLFYSNNFKEIERIQGATFPRDMYGLSVICVIVDADGAICVVASRWNSDGEQERFLSDAELKQVIGQNNFGRLK